MIGLKQPKPVRIYDYTTRQLVGEYVSSSKAERTLGIRQGWISAQLTGRTKKVKSRVTGITYYAEEVK